MAEHRCWNCEQDVAAGEAACRNCGELVWVATKYYLLEPRGSGRFARVFRALDERANKQVALKILLSPYSRFKGECRTLARLKHPSIARYMDADRQHGLDYIVQEWVDGNSLRELFDDLNRRDAWDELTNAFAINLSLQLLDALKHAHERGVVHRDISPGNIMLEEDGAGGRRPVVVDFGLARFTDPSPGTTVTSTIGGTPGFVAPEQILECVRSIN